MSPETFPDSYFLFRWFETNFGTKSLKTYPLSRFQAKFFKFRDQKSQILRGESRFIEAFKAMGIALNEPPWGEIWKILSEMGIRDRF